MRIRQVVLAANELESTREVLEQIFDTRETFRDPPDPGGLGIVNVVMPIGDTFLEVVSPIRAESTAHRYLASSGGDGGYMVIVQYPDIDEAKARAAAEGPGSSGATSSMTSSSGTSTCGSRPSPPCS